MGRMVMGAVWGRGDGLSRRRFLSLAADLFGGAVAFGQVGGEIVPVGVVTSVRVLGVREDYTLTIQTRRQERFGVRLYGVRLPSEEHPLRRQAVQFLRQNFGFRAAELEVVRYVDARTALGMLTLDGVCATEVVLACGMGWCTHPQLLGGRLQRAEATARRRGLGVWREGLPAVQRRL